MVTRHPATAEDVRQFYGEIPGTMQAVCIKRNGETVGVFGVVKDKKTLRFFTETTMTQEELRSVTTWRAVEQIMRIIKKSLIPVVSVAECEEGHKNLQRLGFRRVVDDTYVWGDKWLS